MYSRLLKDLYEWNDMIIWSKDAVRDGRFTRENFLRAQIYHKLFQ